MFKVTDEHIDFIISDLKRKGIVLKDLQENIVDHVCCLTETELSENGNFEAHYEKIIPRFFNQQLKELQQETDSLVNSKSIDLLKSILQVSGVISVLLLGFGVYYKLHHLTGAGIILFAGMLLFCLLFIPSLIILKFKDTDAKHNIVLVSTAFILTLAGGIACLFKIMQWPYANILMTISIIAFLVLFIPMYFVVMNAKPSQKFTTFINIIIMLVAGILLFIMTL
ncbi:MAG: hypothetical protein HRT69_14965 [Flavobacteriaceae bacterium]|nr:hypothetical protein [Flavobacteriaceae bacterium]